MMGNELDLKILHRKINEILLKEWDPIGIQYITEAQDEYINYISPILQLLISGKSHQEIFEFLWWIETQHMGLIGDKQQTDAIAKKIRDLID